MDKNDVEMPKKKGESNRTVTVASMLGSTVLFVLDLYVMINTPGKFSVWIAITLLLLVGIYFFINSILQEINKTKKDTEEQYESMLRSGKASYLLVKKLMEQIEAQARNNQPAVSTEDIITAQKAIAKVTISRNKENTDALMNSNDKVLEKLFDFEDRLGTNKEEILGEQINIIDDSIKELAQKQEELAQKQEELAFSVNELKDTLTSSLGADNIAEFDTKGLEEALGLNVKALEESLKGELRQIQDTINELQVRAEKPVEEVAFAGLDLGESENLLDEEVMLSEESTLSEEPVAESIEDISFDSLDLGESENLLDDETMLSEEPTLDEEPITDNLEDISFDSLDLGESENLLDEEVMLDEESTLDEEPITDNLEDISFDSLDLGESENLLDDEATLDEESILDEEPIADNLEDISFDSLDLGESENLLDESALEEESTFDGLDLEEIGNLDNISLEEPIVEESVKEEPAKVDLSNPNKLMTPDEIAALIASM